MHTIRKKRKSSCRVWFRRVYSKRTTTKNQIRDKYQCAYLWIRSITKKKKKRLPFSSYLYRTILLQFICIGWKLNADGILYGSNVPTDSERKSRKMAEKTIICNGGSMKLFLFFLVFFFFLTTSRPFFRVRPNTARDLLSGA